MISKLASFAAVLICLGCASKSNEDANNDIAKDQNIKSSKPSDSSAKGVSSSQETIEIKDVYLLISDTATDTEVDRFFEEGISTLLNDIDQAYLDTLPEEGVQEKFGLTRRISTKPYKPSITPNKTGPKLRNPTKLLPIREEILPQPSVIQKKFPNDTTPAPPIRRQAIVVREFSGEAGPIKENVPINLITKGADQAPRVPTRRNGYVDISNRPDITRPAWLEGVYVPIQAPSWSKRVYAPQ